MASPAWQIVRGQGPLVAAALHNGHAVREEIADCLALDDAQRLREEDPYTGRWTTIAPTQIISLRSRFEIDLNRSPNRAFYRTERDAWGLKLWKRQPAERIIARSMAQYHQVYAEMRQLFEDLTARYGRVVVLDLHSYNHRRQGPDGPPADPQGNPEVNVGTGTMDRPRWSGLVDRFMADLRAFDYLGRHLDVRENVRFTGGHFPRWIHRTFPDSVCALAVEWKKFFMDEWTRRADPEQLEAIRQALNGTVPGLLHELSHC